MKRVRGRSAAALLAELEAAGVRITREGTNLCVRGNPGVDRRRIARGIRTHKPGLLAELTPLDAELIASEARVAALSLRLRTALHA